MWGRGFSDVEEIDRAYELIDNLAPALQAFLDTIERKLTK